MRVSYKLLSAVLGGAVLLGVTNGFGQDAGTQNTNVTDAGGQTEKVKAARSFRVSNLTDLDVKNSAGETLGSVNDIVVDVASGKIVYVALSHGGVLGIGDKLFAVPFRQMKFAHGQDEMYFVLDVPKDRLKAAPGFDKDNWPDFADPKWTESIENYYDDDVARTSQGATRQ